MTSSSLVGWDLTGMQLWGSPHPLMLCRQVQKTHSSLKMDFGGDFTLVYHCVVSGVKTCLFTSPQAGKATTAGAPGS